jgi:hypothetical protein
MVIDPTEAAISEAVALEAPLTSGAGDEPDVEIVLFPLQPINSPGRQPAKTSTRAR